MPPPPLPCRLPSNTGHSPDAVSMLGHRRRRWANIETALSECPVLAGLTLRIKHQTLKQCCFNAGPASQTVGQHWANIVLSYCVSDSALRMTSGIFQRLNVDLVLGQRRRRWANTKPAMVQRLCRLLLQLAIP